MRPGAALVFFAAASFLVFLLPACFDPAQERFERAEKAFLEQKMDAALIGYRSIPVDFPQSRYAPAALLRQGDLFGSHYRRDDAALEAYGSLLFNYPRSPEAPRAVLRRAKIRLLKFFDYAAAVADLELIRKQYPGFPEMDDVMLLLGKAYGGLSDRARQARALTELIEEYPDSPHAMEARWTQAFLLLAEGKYAEADREFRKILFMVSNPKEAARARWGMAQAREGEGDIDGALSEYEAIREYWEDPDYVAQKVKRLKERQKTR
jgi:TolA-binding protein